MNDFVCFSCCVHYGGAVDSADVFADMDRKWLPRLRTGPT